MMLCSAVLRHTEMFMQGISRMLPIYRERIERKA
jgi:hypothetical protein